MPIQIMSDIWISELSELCISCPEHTPFSRQTNGINQWLTLNCCTIACNSLSWLMNWWFQEVIQFSSFTQKMCSLNQMLTTCITQDCLELSPNIKMNNYYYQHHTHITDFRRKDAVCIGLWWDVYWVSVGCGWRLQVWKWKVSGRLDLCSCPSSLLEALYVLCTDKSVHESAWNDKVSGRGVKMWPLSYWGRQWWVYNMYSWIWNAHVKKKTAKYSFVRVQ